MDFANLPKVELHLHLDCSLSYELVSKLKPGTSLETYRQAFIAPGKCRDLADYIERAIAAIELMQTEENLKLAVFDLFHQLQKDQVIYAEFRFAPLEHTQAGLNPSEVVSAVNQATQEAIKHTNIQAGIILCTLRHYTEDQSMTTVELVNKFRGSCVVGFDIASDEAGYPIKNHIKAFKYANRHGISCTAHAGEACGADSVWETLEHFKPSRIGHGVRSIEDSNLLEHLVMKNIHLEVCPTSNVQTNVYPLIGHHKIDLLYKTGVSISVNTDCRTISDVTLTSEYQLLNSIFQWTVEHFYKCNLEAINHAFCTEDVKIEVRKKLERGYEILNQMQ